MNIEATKINQTNNTATTSKNYSQTDGKTFSDNLKSLSKTEDTNSQKESEKTEENSKTQKEEKDVENKAKSEEKSDGKVEEAIDDLNNVLSKLTQSDEKEKDSLKNNKKFSDNNIKDLSMINNDFNIEKKDTLPQMNPNMNFSGDGQPFSSLMNNNSDKRDSQLSNSSKDLAEEAAILSTMAENIAMANKLSVNSVDENSGINTNKKSGITNEMMLKFDSVIMNEADVEVFANLVNNGEVDLNNLAPESAKKSVEVSKTLADMLAKSMQDNKPVRIEFDNGISVIIRISREGKLTADFLPSTQVAEAYLKENLPLLKQRFDEQNIEYDELNQRERKNQDKEQNRKKDQANE